MKKLEVRCPSCASRGYIEVNEEEVKNTTRGLFAVNVAESIICEHSFVAYVDKNLTIRDTFMADFQLNLPEVTTPRQKVESTPSASFDKIDLSLIKINLTASQISYIIRSILYKKKVVLLTDLAYMIDHVYNFISFITEGSFQANIYVSAESDYNQVEHGDHIVLKGKEVLLDDDHILDKKSGIERNIVQKFLNIYDPKESLIFFRNELLLAFNLSQRIIDYINSLGKKEKIYSKKLIENLQNLEGTKIQITYLDFLYEIVEHYFGIDVPKSSDISNFLGSL
jgi:hypothetical protein